MEKTQRTRYWHCWRPLYTFPTFACFIDEASFIKKQNFGLGTTTTAAAPDY
jgi:hypothetical protein